MQSTTYLTRCLHFGKIWTFPLSTWSRRNFCLPILSFKLAEANRIDTTLLTVLAVNQLMPLGMTSSLKTRSTPVAASVH